LKKLDRINEQDGGSGLILDLMDIGKLEGTEE
jgi:hypothetical protein